MSDHSEPAPLASSEVLIDAQDLWHSFNQVPSICGVSVQVKEREVFGLVGPDGAGKTTLLRIIVGLLDPNKGTALIFGKPATSESATVRSFVGYMPQQYSLYGDLSVDENLSFFGSMFCLERSVFTERRAMLLRLTRLERFGSRRADALSGGMYKKLALACALLHRPRVLVLDEPTNGVDPVSRREFWDLIATFVREGMGVVISTPYMDEASRCTRVALMHKGRLLEQGVPREMLRSFDCRAFRVSCEDRYLLSSRLDGHPSVVALSPAGGALRVVVSPDGIQDVMGIANECGATIHPAHPVFEDLFLARLRQRAASDPEDS